MGTAIFGILGIVIGAILQHKLSQKYFSDKQKKELETQSYIDFIEAVAGLNSAQRNNDKDKENEFNLKLMIAKAKISMHGAQSVIEAIAKMLRDNPHLENKNDLNNYLLIVEKIRETHDLEATGLSKDISRLLFGRDL